MITKKEEVGDYTYNSGTESKQADIQDDVWSLGHSSFRLTAPQSCAAPQARHLSSKNGVCQNC